MRCELKSLPCPGRRPRSSRGPDAMTDTAGGLFCVDDILPAAWAPRSGGIAVTLTGFPGRWGLAATDPAVASLMEPQIDSRPEL